MTQTARPAMHATPPRPMLTATEVAALLGCHRNQVALMREQGTLPAMRHGERSYRYPREAIEAYLRGERSDGGAAAQAVSGSVTLEQVRTEIAAALRQLAALLDGPIGEERR